MARYAKPRKTRFAGGVTERYRNALALSLGSRRLVSWFLLDCLLYLSPELALQWARLKLAFYEGDDSALAPAMDFAAEHGVGDPDGTAEGFRRVRLKNPGLAAAYREAVNRLELAL